MRIFDAVRTLFRYLMIMTKSLNYYSKRAERKIGKRQSDIIVSLSTIPSRIGLIDPTLKSLLDQTVIPKYIYINVPKFSRREQCEYAIPDKFLNHPIIKIIHSDKDWGPATKSIPAIQEEKKANSPLLILDDDYVYHERTLETYEKYKEEYKNSVLCLRGWNLPKDMIHRNKIRFNGTDIKHFKRANLVEGSSSYLIRPEFFKDDFFDYESAPDEAFFCDDIWISGHLNKHNVPIYIMPMNATIPRILSFSTRNTIRLAEKENSEDANENVVYRYYEKDWQQIED